MNPKASELYINLLRETLLDNLHGGQKKIGGSLSSADQVENGKVWPERAYTMIGRKRLNNIRQVIETCIDEDIDGDILEAGVWRGGACIYARGILKAHGIKNRRVLVADSFAGLPPPDSEKYPQDKSDIHHTFKVLAVDQHTVAENFRRFDLWDEQVLLIPGFFENSLNNNSSIGPLSVLRADGDMYSSTIQILENLYHKVNPGGFVIIDDYGAVEGCKQAVTDFREKHCIAAPLVKIDWTGMYWRKSVTD